MLLQTNAANMDPAEARIYRAKIAKLWKQPDLAKSIESYEPQPNPIEQQIQMMQLEKAKLELSMVAKQIEEMDSRIVERISRTEENALDRELKNAKIKETVARASLLIEQADALANDFVKDVTGQKRREYELDQEFKAAAEIAKKKAGSKVSNAKIDKITGEPNG